MSATVRVLGQEVLDAFGRSHADARKALVAWLSIAEEQNWGSIVEVRSVYPHADFAKPYTVFNVKGGRYRLVTLINYQLQIVTIIDCLTHAEYDKGTWK